MHFLSLTQKAYAGSFFNSGGSLNTVTCSYLPVPVAGEGRVSLPSLMTYIIDRHSVTHVCIIP